MSKQFDLYKHKSSYNATSVAPLWVSETVMQSQPLCVMAVHRNVHICAQKNANYKQYNGTCRTLCVCLYVYGRC